MKKSGSAKWKGRIKDGIGSVSTETGVLRDAPYGFVARFEGGKGTNPEELIGAAHAACFTMALSKGLGDAGYTADAIRTRADITLEKQGDGFAITASHLTMEAVVPEIDAAKFAEIAEQTKVGCPVSRLLNATITMDAKLTV
jgi:osmotically inducible protein OsmC